jgi:hypothetical protein
MPARSVQPSTLLPVGPTGPLAASDPNGLRPAPSAAVPRRLRLATLGAIVVGALVFVSAGSPALAGPVFLVGLILGLPHGAADHVTLALATGRRPSRREATTTAGLYGLGVAVAVMGFCCSPWLCRCSTSERRTGARSGPLRSPSWPSASSPWSDP